jgi:cytochrome c biogenesis protein CcdA
MNENRLMQQVGTIFGGLMTFVWLGIGLYFIFSPNLYYVDKPLRVILGSACVFYGLYRLYRTYVKVIEVFFTDEDDEK